DYSALSQAHGILYCLGIQEYYEVNVRIARTDLWVVRLSGYSQESGEAEGLGRFFYIPCSLASFIVTIKGQRNP
ncbi:MAG: hypothetical protein QGG64_19195, partial [Candidatus Latescibacteria bacterium]|nr:hypothetical protein [Candidatus Latescibacterota bacterium]